MGRSRGHVALGLALALPAGLAGACAIVLAVLAALEGDWLFVLWALAAVACLSTVQFGVRFAGIRRAR